LQKAKHWSGVTSVFCFQNERFSATLSSIEGKKENNEKGISRIACRCLAGGLRAGARAGLAHRSAHQ
jgi:hypothetical protein